MGHAAVRWWCTFSFALNLWWLHGTADDEDLLSHCRGLDVQALYPGELQVSGGNTIRCELNRERPECWFGARILSISGGTGSLAWADGDLTHVKVAMGDIRWLDREDGPRDCWQPFVSFVIALRNDGYKGG